MQSITPSTVPKKWAEFNLYHHDGHTGISKLDYVSATRVKNYLMKDPILDWLRQHYSRLGLNTPEELAMKLSNPEEWVKLHQERSGMMKAEQGKLKVLFDKGNKFEAAVEEELFRRFPEQVVKLDRAGNWDQWERQYARTVQLMKDGTPIILQAALINESNKTFGAADLVVRSDWLEKIWDETFYEAETHIKAPKLGTPYHYVVVDIKFSSLSLASDGEHLLNTKLMPAYKGQLLIYTAAVGQIQGYTPEKAFVMGKSYRYTSQRNKKRHTVEGYNCFDRLGVINYDDRDKKYVAQTQEALRWIRRVRYEGKEWTFFPQPTVRELYPNMCNTQYDAPYHMVKKEIATRLEELTLLWMVGVNHRDHAHEQGIFRYSDPRCSAKTLGVKGKKTAPVLDRIIRMLQCDDPEVKLIPQLIKNNNADWQTKHDIEFFIDFEAIQPVFDENQSMVLENSKSDSNIIFMVGVGYETPMGEWEYHNLAIPRCNLHDRADVLRGESELLDRFQKFVEAKITDHMVHHNITNPKLCFPRFFHWGHAEQSLLKGANRRHGSRFSGILREPTWIDMLTVFRGEPVIIQGTMKFGLKEIANRMYQLGMITTKWEEDGPTGGLTAMQDGIRYYNLLHQYNTTPEAQRKPLEGPTSTAVARFANVVDYNEVDCKVVWEIVTYLRTHHCTPAEDDPSSQEG